MSKGTRDKREAFAAKSVQMLNSGTPFFNRLGASPFPQKNFESGRSYQGVNASYLQDAMMEKGYYAADWMTFSDANKMNLSVRKGEQGVLLENWQVKEGKPHCEGYKVFNIQQLEGDHPKLRERLEHYQQQTPLQNAFNAANFFLEAHGKDYLRPEDNTVKDFQKAIAAAVNERSKTMYPGQDVSLSSAIATSFVLQELGLPQQQPWETERSLMKGWASIIQQDDKELFRSVRDSNKVMTDVMLTYNREVELSKTSAHDRIQVGQRDIDAVIGFATPATPNGKGDILQAYAMTADKNAFAQNLPNLYGEIDGSIHDTQNKALLRYSMNEEGVTLRKSLANSQITETTISWNDFSKQVESSITQGRFMSQDRDKEFSLENPNQLSFDVDQDGNFKQELLDTAREGLKHDSGFYIGQDDTEANRLKQEAQQKTAEATRAEQMTQGARQMPRGNDSNLRGANLNANQEAVVNAVNKSTTEIADLRSEAATLNEQAGKTGFMAAMDEAKAYFEDNGVKNSFSIAPNDGQEYYGKVIGIVGEAPDKFAIQQIADNQAVIHQVTEISREESLLTNEEMAIISDAGAIHSVTTMRQALMEKEREEELGDREA